MIASSNILIGISDNKNNTLQYQVVISQYKRTFIPKLF